MRGTAAYLLVFPRAYAGAAVVFAGMDLAWLTFANARLYRPVLGPILAADVRLGPAAAFYLIYLLGLTVFAIRRALAGGGWRAHRATVIAAEPEASDKQNRPHTHGIVLLHLHGSLSISGYCGAESLHQRLATFVSAL